MYTIGGFIFKTKQAILEHAQQLKKVPDTVYPEESAEYRFLIDLIAQGHHNPGKKLRRKVKEFFVEETGKYVTRFMIRYDDDSEEEFSYLKCKDYLNRDAIDVQETEAWKSLQSACRTAVADQVSEYWNTHEHVCTECGATDVFTEVHHDIKEFVDLLIDFDEGRTDTPRVFDDLPQAQFDGLRGTRLFRACDEKYEKEFCKYHKETAVLTILCTPCNLAKPRYAGIRKGIHRKRSNTEHQLKEKTDDKNSEEKV